MNFIIFFLTVASVANQAFAGAQVGSGEAEKELNSSSLFPPPTLTVSHLALSPPSLRPARCNFDETNNSFDTPFAAVHGDRTQRRVSKSESQTSEWKRDTSDRTYENDVKERAKDILSMLDDYPDVRTCVLNTLNRKNRRESVSAVSATLIMDSANSSLSSGHHDMPFSVSLPYDIAPPRPTIRVLSMDGGGIRGIMMAYFLMRLEDRLKTPVQSLFHLVAGTSAGGILATAMSLRSLEDPSKPRFSARQLYDMLGEEAPNLFTKSWWSYLGITGPKYKDPIKVFQRVLGEDTPFEDGLVKAMVTTYDLEANAVKVITNFTSLECKRSNRRDFEVFAAADVARATSAAPTFYAPHKCKPLKNGLQDWYIAGDGGIGANNPSLMVLREALRTYPGAEITMVSLGTGNKTKPLRYQDVESAGTLKWVQMGLIDMLMNAPNSLVEEELDNAFRPMVQDDGSYEPLVKGLFCRFNPSVEDPSLDNIQPDNLRSLRNTMKSEISRPGSQWDSLVRALSPNPVKESLDRMSISCNTAPIMT